MSQDAAQVPAWLNVTKTLIPDFVVSNPKVCQSSLFCFDLSVGSRGRDLVAINFAFEYTRLPMLRNTGWAFLCSCAVVAQLCKKGPFLAHPYILLINLIYLFVTCEQ